MGAAQEHGTLYVKFESANGKKSGVPLEGSTYTLGHAAPGSATDRRQFYPLAFRHGGMTLDENGKMWIIMKATAADIVESEDSRMYLDCTLINKATGDMQPITLTFEEFTGFTSGGTVDKTFTNAGDVLNLAYYKVDAGNQLVLGHPSGLGKAYIYIGDDT
jgi:hypothetical protein